MNVLEPQQKKSAVVITDARLEGIQALPAGTQFVRWLGKDEILLKGADHLIRHSLVAGEDYIFDAPADWSGPAVSGSVIPGTDIQYLVTADGRFGVQQGRQPLREVLPLIKATRFVAIANDLSLFGGVDGEKRLWVQHGLDGKPEVVASGVEAVFWGPVSRRAAVREASGRTRVYDGRDGSWVDLGNVSGAQWSPDEEELLFVEVGYLSLLVDHRIERLCELNRIGPVAGAVISAGGDRAFLLAGIGGGLDVWMTALPASPARKR
jgi:hypothetical protein